MELVSGLYIQSIFSRRCSHLNLAPFYYDSNSKLHCSSHVGKENAWWSSLFLSLSGPFFFFSHIAVYDVLGLVFFMSSALFIQKKNLAHIALAGIFAGLAIITKYAFIIYFPILFLLLYIVTEHRVFLKSLIFLLFSVIIPIFHNLIVFKSLFPDSYASYQATELGFNSLYSLGVSLFILLRTFSTQSGSQK